MEMLSVSLQYPSLSVPNTMQIECDVRIVIHCLGLSCRSSYMLSILPGFWCVEHEEKPCFRGQHDFVVVLLICSNCVHCLKSPPGCAKDSLTALNHVF